MNPVLESSNADDRLLNGVTPESFINGDSVLYLEGMELSASLKNEIRVIARVFGLDLLYLFGSAARGDVHAGSDVDVAFASSRLSDRDLVALRTRLSKTFASDVDLVDLSLASPLLARQILSEGIALFGSERDLDAFYRSTMKRYFDARPFFLVTEQYVKDRLAV